MTMTSRKGGSTNGTTGGGIDKRSRVIVLGAGVAGLGCARELQQRGLDVLVVEARSRVGGRLKTEPIEVVGDGPSGRVTINGKKNSFARTGALASAESTTASDDNGNDNSSNTNTKKRPRKSTTGSMSSNSNSSQYPIDLGGALIHGIDENPIHMITTQLGVPTVEVSSECLLMDSTGWPFDHTVDDQMSKFFNSCLDTTFERVELDRSSSESFGSLFRTVCREKQAELGRGFGGIHATAIEHHPLLQWHRANLEIPSGASFDQLGYTWNDDEQYGYDGAHSAPGQTGWSFVMEQLAEGLTILRSSPVSCVRVVVPDGMDYPDQLEILQEEESTTETETKESTAAETAVSTTITATSSTNSTADNVVENSNSPTDQTNSDLTSNNPAITVGEFASDAATTTTTTIVDSVVQQSDGTTLNAGKKKSVVHDVAVAAFAPPSIPLPPVNLQPTRLSRRIRGVDADVRRSARSTKGVIQRLNVGHDLGHCYDDPNRKSKSGKPKQGQESGRSGQMEEHRARDEDNDDEEEDMTPQSKIHVSLENGTNLECDAVVCTLPLGVLKVPEGKPGHVKFIPPLPDAKKAAIDQLGCGLLNKCVLSFEASFWPESDFLGMAGDERSYLVLNAMKYTQKPILVFMYGGDVAREIEDWSDREVVEDCLRVLKKICGKTIPEPMDYIVTRWSQEPFSKMSFSYIPPGADGQQQLSAMGDAIRDPIRHEKPLIMFAGEHTTPFHPSTMHGAFLSGVREAYRYDLYLNPALNNHIKFESNNIYAHTFSMPRVYRSIKAASGSSPKRPKATPKSPKKGQTTTVDPNIERERRSRRRGFGGMTLRKRPESFTTAETASKTAKTPKSPSKSTATSTKSSTFHETITRKSQRSRSSYATTLGRVSELGSAGNDEDLRLKRLDALEDRTLRRAVESYGWQNSSLICSKVVPVVGSMRERSVNQIRSRLNQIVSITKDSPEDVTEIQGIVEKWKVVDNNIKDASTKLQSKEAQPVVVSRYRTKTETSEGGMSLRRSITRPTKLE